MEPERELTSGLSGFLASNDLTDEVYTAIVQLTDLRLAGKTLADLPASEAERLIRVLGRTQIQEILRIADLDLAMREHGSNGTDVAHDPSDN